MVGGTEEHEVPSCGVLGWRPQWLQRYAKANVYALAFGMLGFSNRASRAYFFGTLSTIEKRFAIPSRTSGLISSIFELGVLLGVAFLGYMGHRLHGPKTVVTGAIIIAFACMLMSSPHFFFGPGEDARAFARADADADADAAAAEETADGLAPGPLHSSPEAEADAALCGLPVAAECDAEDGQVGGGERETETATGILLSGLFIEGLGESAQLTVGLAYLDNNAHKNKAPLLLALCQLIDMFGNLVGSFLASFTLQKYVDPSVTPPFDETHPRWIGAWWMGWPVVATMLVLTSFPVLLFPRELPCAAKRRREKTDKEGPKSGIPTLNDFWNALKRMYKNKILVLNILSAICLSTAYVGFGTFLPKYIETQYRRSASDASFISGWMGLVFTGIGILAAAIVIVRFKPTARTLALWNVMVEVMEALSHFLYAFLFCAHMDISGHKDVDGSWNLTETCNAGCGCSPDTKYFPVCSTDNSITYYSPCHAGCSGSQLLLNGTTMYTGCACTADGLANSGACPAECPLNFALFVGMGCLIILLSASGRAGNALVVFRSVSVEDKSLSIAIGEIVLCTLAYFPAPNLFGRLVDTTCIVWGKICGRSGNCWVYNEHQMRYVINFTVGGCLVVGTLLDIGVWYYSTDVEMYEEEPKEQSELEMRRMADGGAEEEREAEST